LGTDVIVIVMTSDSQMGALDPILELAIGVGVQENMDLHRVYGMSSSTQASPDPFVNLAIPIGHIRFVIVVLLREKVS
jgi:hypothetical protein